MQFCDLGMLIRMIQLQFINSEMIIWNVLQLIGGGSSNEAELIAVRLTSNILNNEYH